MRRFLLIVGICIVVFLCAIGIKIAYTSLSERSFDIDSSITDSISFRQISSAIAQGVEFSEYSRTKSDMDILGLWPSEFFTVYDIDIPSETCMVNLFVAVPHLDLAIDEVFCSFYTVSQPQYLREQDPKLKSCTYNLYSQYGYLDITTNGESVFQLESKIEACLLEIASLSDAANAALPTAMTVQKSN